MNQTILLIISIVNLIALPLVAFIIRMANGQTRNPDEEIISEFIQGLFRKIITPQEGP